MHTQALLRAEARSATDALVPAACTINPFCFLSGRTQSALIQMDDSGTHRECRAKRMKMSSDSGHVAVPCDVAADRAELARAGCCWRPDSRREVRWDTWRQVLKASLHAHQQRRQAILCAERSRAESHAMPQKKSKLAADSYHKPRCNQVPGSHLPAVRQKCERCHGCCHAQRPCRASFVCRHHCLSALFASCCWQAQTASPPLRQSLLAARTRRHCRRRPHLVRRHRSRAPQAALSQPAQFRCARSDGRVNHVADVWMLYPMAWWVRTLSHLI